MAKITINLEASGEVLESIEALLDNSLPFMADNVKIKIDGRG
jgi:hypothetical protein